MTREDQIKKAAEIIAYGCSDELEAALIKDFPELKENNDERIRKELIEIVNSLGTGVIPIPENREEMLAYLEKQKEQVMDETDKIAAAYQLGRSDERKQKEQKPISFNEPYNPDDYEVVMEGEATGLRRKEQKPTEANEHSNAELCKHQKELYAFKAFAAKQAREHHISFVHDFEWDNFCVELLSFFNEKEQHPAEWSEEDETAYGDLIWCIEQARKSAKDENDMGNIWFAENWVKNRFKSLRPQPHWKPNEKEIIAFENLLKGEFPDKIFPGATLSGLLGKLKMLYYNAAIPYWKPSEEQMDALKHFIRIWGESGIMSSQNSILCAAKSLLNDLKKL